MFNQHLDSILAKPRTIPCSFKSHGDDGSGRSVSWRKTMIVWWVNIATYFATGVVQSEFQEMKRLTIQKAFRKVLIGLHVYCPATWVREAKSRAPHCASRCGISAFTSTGSTGGNENVARFSGVARRVMAQFEITC